MSTDTTVQATTPPNGQPPVVPPVLPDPNKEPDNDPPWLAKRLERAEKSGEKKAVDAAKKAILAEMGIDDPESVKKIVAEQKKRDDERKTVEQKLAEESTARKKFETDLAQYVEATKTLAGEQLSTLSEEQKAAVLALAGEDPAKQIKTIAALRPTWKSAAPPAAVIDDSKKPGGATPAPDKAPPPKPADTAPPAGAPPPAGSVVSGNHLATYEALQKTAPFHAALYFAHHGRAILDARKSRGG